MPVPLANGRSAAGNVVASAAPAQEREKWLPHLESVGLAAGDFLYRTGDRLAEVYFPLDCVVAVLGMSRSGATSGVALIGADGIIGVSAALGDTRAGGYALVQHAGRSLRLPTAVFNESFGRSPKLRSIVLRYVSSMVTQMAQTSLCNSQHAVEQRLRRWLLQMLDRLPSADLRVTQEAIGAVLGVRREAITVAAQRLQALGAIANTRGRITVLSRERVAEGCCECYAVLRDELERATRDISTA